MAAGLEESTQANQSSAKGRKPSTTRKGRKCKQPVEDLVNSVISEDQAMNLTDLVKNDGLEQHTSCCKTQAPAISQLTGALSLEEEKITLPMETMAEQYDLNMNQQVTQIFQTSQNISSPESPTEIEAPPLVKVEEKKRSCTCSKGQCKKMYCVCLKNA